MKKILLIALVAVALLLGSCTKDNRGGELGSAAVQSVSLNKPTTSILEGATETLSAVVAPAEAKNKAVSWSTSNVNVAMINAEGLVTAIKAGTATITVITRDGNKTATCVVTVSKTVVAVEGVFLKKAATTILEGATEPLMATVAPATATNQNVTWTSSDAAVATVSEAGLVTALKEGTATITVTTQDGKKTATCVVTVSKTVVAVTGVSLNKATTSLFKGATETLGAVVAPADATNQKVTWTSSNAAIATVSTAGLVTAVKAGMATITVTTQDGNKTATCTVTVSPIAVTGVSIPTVATISVGTANTLNATVLPVDASNKAVTWASSDAAIATVSEAGLVTAVKEGTATITVTTQDGNKTATCAVTAVVAVVIGDLSWAVGNLVADGANGCKIGAPTDYGLYFHWGSLVGWQGGATGDGTGVTNDRLALAVKVKPTSYTGTTWPAGYYKDKSAPIGKDNSLPATDDAGTGIGDPCRYYLGASWHTPTEAEYFSLIGVDGANTNKGIPLQVTGSALVFPGSGYRGNVAGVLDNMGGFGPHWSSSAISDVCGSLLSFNNSSTVGKGEYLRSFGFPVRCVAPTR